ncbi:hypothetical protein K438DRAFT_1891710 [Mycena galopus ATCC 62051]|nr:hypothetical protein K438DRAFT_1891710 [Mycena galopus ATCC 62051]
MHFSTILVALAAASAPALATPTERGLSLHHRGIHPIQSNFTAKFSSVYVEVCGGTGPNLTNPTDGVCYGITAPDTACLNLNQLNFTVTTFYLVYCLPRGCDRSASLLCNSELPEARASFLLPQTTRFLGPCVTKWLSNFRDTRFTSKGSHRTTL